MARLDAPTVTLEWVRREPDGNHAVEDFPGLTAEVAAAAKAGLELTPNFVSARILTARPPAAAVALAPSTVEMAYSPGQKRDTVGRFGSGGSSGAPAGRAGPGGPMSAKDARESLEAVGIRADMGGVHEDLRGEVVESLINAKIDHPLLFKAMDVDVTTGPLPGTAVAETRSYTLNYASHDGVPGMAGGYMRGGATIVLNEKTFGDGSARAAMADAGKKGWLAGDTIDHAIQHEVGHVFDSALGHPSSEVKGVRSLTTSGDQSPFMQAASAVSNPAPSTYARRNTGERFAEEYASIAITGKPTKYADSIIVDQLMRQHG